MATSSINGRNARLQMRLTYRVVQNTLVEQNIAPRYAYEALKRKHFGVIPGLRPQLKRYVPVIAKKKVKIFRMADLAQEQYRQKLVDLLRQGLQQDFDRVRGDLTDEIKRVEAKVDHANMSLETIKAHLGIV